MEDKCGKAYKKVMLQIPTRTERIQFAVKEKEANHKNGKNQRYYRKNRCVAVISVLLIIVLFSVVTMQEPNQISFIVWAAEGNPTELGNGAVRLQKNVDFESAGYMVDESHEVAEFVYRFRILCEGEDIKNITYSIIGEETVSSIIELKNNMVWFAEISNKTYDAIDKEYPFAYRSFGEKDVRTTYVYLGSSYTVDAERQNDKEYCIEYRLRKNEDGEFVAEPFDISVSVEKMDGSIVRKILHLVPEFDVVNNWQEIQFQHELWMQENR